MTDELATKLDKIIFLLSLAFADQIEAARTKVLADPIANAILSAAADDFVSAGELKGRVAAATRQSERTVSRRIAQLVASGWLQAEGSGSTVSYRSMGVA